MSGEIKCKIALPEVSWIKVQARITVPLLGPSHSPLSWVLIDDECVSNQLILWCFDWATDCVLLPKK